MRDKALYQDFKPAVGRKNAAAIRQGFAAGALRLFQAGRKATIEAIVDGDDPTEAFHLPAALVRIAAEVVGPQTQEGPGATQDDRHYVPLAYLRTEGEASDDKELKLAVFWVMADLSAVSKQGHRMLLFDSDAKSVPFCQSAFECREALRLSRAGDQVGLRKIIESGDLKYTDDPTVALIIERHVGYKKDLNTAGVRFITGPHKDERGYVLEGYTMIPVLQCLTEKQAQAQLGNKRAAATKRR